MRHRSDSPLVISRHLPARSPTGVRVIALSFMTLFPGQRTEFFTAELNEKMYVWIPVPAITVLLRELNLQVRCGKKRMESDIAVETSRPSRSSPPVASLFCRWFSASTATPVTSWTCSASPRACRGECHQPGSQRTPGRAGCGAG